MKLIRDLAQLPDGLRGGAVAIGNFDGVHIGHARLVASLRQQASAIGGPALVFTFDPHPARLLRPALTPPPLTWTDRKAQLLGELGADSMIAYPTDEAMLTMTAEAFFEQIIVARLGARAMVEGPNFRFGRDRAGTIERLARLCHEAGIALQIVEPVKIDDDANPSVAEAYVSSSRIRHLVAEGHMESARRLLTRPYRIRGRVTHGAGRGAKIGFPTANLEAVDTLLPSEGVYAAMAIPSHGGQAQGQWPAAVNIGPNPTFGEHVLKVEAHLIGFDGPLCGQVLELDFLARLRDIHPFASIDELQTQLALDVKSVAELAKVWQTES